MHRYLLIIVFVIIFLLLFNKKKNDFKLDIEKTSDSTWYFVLNWQPPSEGWGSNYNVNYNGEINSTDGKIKIPIYADTESFLFPISTTPDNYTVSITASNQFGSGPLAKQNITIPILTPGFLENFASLS